MHESENFSAGAIAAMMVRSVLDEEELENEIIVENFEHIPLAAAFAHPELRGEDLPSNPGLLRAMLGSPPFSSCAPPSLLSPAPFSYT